MSLESFRDEFAVTARRAYLANGSVTPAARAVLAASRAWQEEWAEDPQVAYRRYPQLRERLRETTATLLGCDPDEVAITDNASRGSILAVRMLARRAGDHVVVDRTTYPSSRYPWLALTGKQLRHVDDGGENGPEPILHRITPSTCAVSVSHVDFLSGARHDIAALAQGAHAQGALLIVDGSQSVGAVPVDVRAAGVDVLVGTYGKWLLAGPGLGFLYVRRGLLDDAPLLEPGWRNFAVKDGAWPTGAVPPLVPGARQFEPGLPNVNGIVMAQAGLDLLLRTGMEAVAAAITSLVGRAREGLVARGLPVQTPEAPHRRAGLLAFPFAQAPELAAFLRTNGVEITGYPYGHVRIDPHAYNTEEEIDRMLVLVDRYLDGGSRA